MYDAIVVGARCGGSPTAMLLAACGYYSYFSGIRQEDIELDVPDRRLWWCANERRPPSGDGELADRGLSDHPQ